ncbi:MAG: hypothetical protein CL910_20505 [Deltaproteobacteria bacterium]|jgi:hypothetical protein|nr:hypothetical protein [Deltaproteobacteria bacterium]
MAAAACIVPGTRNRLPTHTDHGPEGLPGAPPGPRAALALLALLPAAVLGFATGAWLALAGAPPLEVADVSAPAPGPVGTRSHSGLEPTFWRPPGSTAARPDIRLRPRTFRPSYALHARIGDANAAADLQGPWRLAARNHP